jgi:MFS family permease
VGSVYVAVVAWWWWGRRDNVDHGGSWRVFAVVCAIPSLVGWMLVYKHVPESPRFLALNGQHGRAVVVAQELADRLGYRGPEWTVDEAREHFPPRHDTTSGRRGGLLLNSCRELGIGAASLYVPTLRQTTCSLQVVWFSLSFGSYGLYTWINKLFVAVHLENVYFNALLFALSNLPGNLLSAYFLDRVGRARLLIASIMASALSLMSFAYMVFQNSAAEPNDTAINAAPPPISTTWIVVSACAFQCFTIMSWNAIDVLTTELFPTAVRTTGTGLCAACGRVGAMLAQIVNGALIANPAALLVVAATTLLIGAVAPTLLPDDKTGLPVSDTVGSGTRILGNNSISYPYSTAATTGTSHEMTVRETHDDPAYRVLLSTPGSSYHVV